MKIAEELRRAVLQAGIEGRLTGGRCEGWRFVRLGDIGEIIGGGTPDTSKSEYWHGRIAWITPADMGTLKSKYISHGARNITEKGLASSSARIMPKGSIIFSSRAPIGYIAIAENDICTNQGCKSVRLYDGNLSEYVYFALLAIRDNIKKMGSGTTFKEISGRIFSSVIIPLPPLNEQHRIVSRLDSILPLIAELEAAENELEAIERRFPGDMRDSLLQAAIEGKLTGGTEGWRWVRLKDVGITSTGTTPSTEHQEYYNGDIPFIGPADLNFYGTINYDTNKKLTHEGMQKSRCVNAGSVLQVCIGTIGKVNVTEKLVCFNQQINAITPTQIDSYFLCYVLRSPYWQKQMQDNTSQTTLPILNRRKWENLIIPLPPLEQQHKIVSRLNKLLPLCDSLENLL